MKTLKPSTEQATALDTFIKLMRAAESVSADVHRNLSRDGLTISQFGILEALFHRGPMSQKELAGKILKSAGNITMVINNLEKRGLVARERSLADRRSYLISPTPSGTALIAALFPPHAETIRKRMSVLSARDQKELGKLLKRLGRPDIRPVQTAAARKLKNKIRRK